MKLIVRATGDSVKSDTNVYTQELKAGLTVVKANGNSFKSLEYAITGVIVVVIVGALYARKRRR